METQSGWSLAELAEILGGTLEGPSDFRVLRPAPADDDDSQGLAFAESEKYIGRAYASGVGAVIVPLDAPESEKPLIRHAHPRAAYGHFLALAARPLPLNEGVHPSAHVDPTAIVDPSAQIGAFAVVEAHAVVGPGTRVYPFAYVGENCRLGQRVTVFPHAVLVQDVTVGDGTIIHPGAVIGADGFGFVWDGKRRVKVPQVGGVQLGSQVEIGANTTVDRATAGNTQLGEGVKIDNLVQIAHNVKVGAHTVMASGCGISGSTTIGARVTLGGSVGVADHVSIGDDAIVAARTGVSGSLAGAQGYFGYMAQPIGEAKRSIAVQRKLPSLVDRIRQLEKRLSELESK